MSGRRLQIGNYTGDDCPTFGIPPITRRYVEVCPSFVALSRSSAIHFRLFPTKPCQYSDISSWSGTVLLLSSTRSPEKLSSNLEVHSLLRLHQIREMDFSSVDFCFKCLHLRLHLFQLFVKVGSHA